MTREDIKTLFPDASKEAISQLLDINSSDIGKAVSKAQGTQDELEGKVKSLTEQVTDLQNQVTTLTKETSDKDQTITTLKAQHETALKELTTQHETALSGLNDQLKAAQDRATVADSLTEQVAQLTKDVADREKKLADSTKEFKIKDALRGLHARNVDVVWPLLHLDQITVKGGELKGLSEQIEALKQSDAYLFDTNTGNQRGGFPASQEIGGTSGSANADMNAAIRAAAGRG